MRRPPVARRVAALCLALGLLFSALPLAVLAQDPEPPLFEDAFDISGDSGLEDAVYRWRIGESGQQWRLEATRGGDDPWTRVTLHDADGVELDRSTGSDRAALFDLGLEPGEYRVRVEREAGESPRSRMTTKDGLHRWSPGARPQGVWPGPATMRTSSA